MAIANGKIKSIFSLEIGSTDYVSDIHGFRLYSEDLPPERVTFGKYQTGSAVKWFLEIDAVFDGGSEGSLHDFLWRNSGSQSEFIIKPFKEFDPGTKRFYTGNLRVGYKPDLMVTSGKNSVYEYKFDIIGQPIRSDQPGGYLTAGYYDEY